MEKAEYKGKGKYGIYTEEMIFGEDGGRFGGSRERKGLGRGVGGGEGGRGRGGGRGEGRGED